MATDRYAQPPSRVLHIRNLPYEATHEELEELAQPFGHVTQSKLSVGPNRNQAFIQFNDQSTAVRMVTHFASASEPAKVRGKTVYLQYSTRNEIINSTVRAGEGGGSNILLVSLENMDPSLNITIDTLHLVFSAFGTVHKIATFEKTSGFQALVQYPDSVTAEMVRSQLDNRHIPKHLLDDHPSPPLLKITFSQHTDLNIKYQSHRSRDYMNPYLPVAPFAADAGLGIGMQAPISSDPQSGHVLLVQIENQAYPVTVEPLHTVFSPYGTVDKISVFEKNGSWQALIQYNDAGSACNAKVALEGHAIYDGGYNRIKLTYSIHKDLNVRVNNERGWDYTGANLQPQAGGANTPGGVNGLAVGPEDAPTGADYEAMHDHIASAAASLMQQRNGVMGGPPGSSHHMMGRGGPPPPGGYHSPAVPGGYMGSRPPYAGGPPPGGPPMHAPGAGTYGHPPYAGGPPPRGPPPRGPPYQTNAGWTGGTPPRGPPAGGYAPRGPPQRY